MTSAASPPSTAPAVIKIGVSTATGDVELTATLDDNPAARSLLDQLPLRLQFHDYNHVEKLAPLPRPLTMTGMPSGADPGPGDVGFYAPAGVLVLYYRQVGYWPGIARIGHLLPQDVQLLVSLEDEFTATITREH